MTELLLAMMLLMTLEEDTRCGLEVRVVDQQGPLPGALVHLFEKNKEPRILAADVDGIVSFDHLNTFTTYFAGATFPGYQKVGEETSCTGPDGKPVVLLLREPEVTWPKPPESKRNTLPQEVGRSR